MLGGNGTPLHQACMYGNLEKAKKLIAEGAAINARDFSQQTPLHETCIHDHLEVAMTLIEKGADIDARDKDQYTPLLLAYLFTPFLI